MVSCVKFVVYFDGFCIYKFSEVFNYVNFVVVQNMIVRLMDVVNVGLMVFYQFCLVEVFYIDIKVVIFCIKVYCFCDLCVVLYYFFWYVVNVDISVVEIFGFDESDFCVIYCCVVSGSDIIVVIINVQVVKMCCYYFF